MGLEVGLGLGKATGGCNSHEIGGLATAFNGKIAIYVGLPSGCS